jgi:hypothetical protein
VDTAAVYSEYSDADDAALYDVLNPWDPERSPGDRFYHELVAGTDGTVLRVDRARLRFLDVPGLGAFLAEAGYETESQYGDWHRGPVSATSQEIITIARRPA